MQIWRLILKIQEVSHTVGFRVALGDIGRCFDENIFVVLQEFFEETTLCFKNVNINIGMQP